MGRSWRSRGRRSSTPRSVRGGTAAPRPPPRAERREATILRLLKEGGNNRQIARELNVSVSTDKAHLQGLFLRHDVADRTRLVARLLSEPRRASDEEEAPG